MYGSGYSYSLAVFLHEQIKTRGDLVDMKNICRCRTPGYLAQNKHSLCNTLSLWYKGSHVLLICVPLSPFVMSKPILLAYTYKLGGILKLSFVRWLLVRTDDDPVSQSYRTLLAQHWHAGWLSGDDTESHTRYTIKSYPAAHTKTEKHIQNKFIHTPI
jgi:hypothetical protein